MSTHGGKRRGAGRPKSNSTRVMRVPERMISAVSAYLQDQHLFSLPLYSNKVSAGFPSPADDHIECELDLNTHLIKHPSSTFLVRVSGESMIGAGIYPDDILVVDRSLAPDIGRIVIVALDGELTVKRLQKKQGILYLMPENPAYSPIAIKELQEVNIWGVVTNVIHAV